MKSDLKKYRADSNDLKECKVEAKALKEYGNDDKSFEMR